MAPYLFILFALAMLLFLIAALQGQNYENSVLNSDLSSVGEGNTLFEEMKQRLQQEQPEAGFRLMKPYTDEEEALLNNLARKKREIRNNIGVHEFIDDGDVDGIDQAMNAVTTKAHTLLARKRKIERARRFIEQVSLEDLERSEDQVDDNMDALLVALDKLLVSLVELEVDSSQSKTNRLISEVEESAQKIEDISDSFGDLRHEMDDFASYLDEFDGFMVDSAA